MPPTLNRDHIQPGDRVCAAVSGGADSVALLLLLHDENRQPRNALGVGISAVHVHHGLRGLEADADLEFVRDLCDRLAIPLHVRHASVPDRLAAVRLAGDAETMEEAARVLRYGVFDELLASGHADAILTAHTLDDQAETVLMKLLRGAWTEGLSGIHPVLLRTSPSAAPIRSVAARPGILASRNGRVLRPLLGVRRADLRAWLQSAGQPWREDASNTDETFTRNRLRHRILPILREENPSLDQTLANLAELAREEEARWQVELDRTLPQLLLPGKPVRGGGRAVAHTAAEQTVAIELDRLRPLDPALRRRVLRAAARSLGARLNFDETARLLALVGSSGEQHQAHSRAGSTLHLSAGLRAERSARELRLFRLTDPLPPNPVA